MLMHGDTELLRKELEGMVPVAHLETAMEVVWAEQAEVKRLQKRLAQITAASLGTSQERMLPILGRRRRRLMSSLLL
jgi:hypothetical protein